MTIEMRAKPNPVYSLIDRCESKFIFGVKALKENQNFLIRELLSRILAIVSPIFFALMFTLKLVGGTWDIATSALNKQRAIMTLKAIGLALACTLMALPVGMIKPDLLAKTPRTVLVPLPTPSGERHAMAEQALATMSDEEMDKQWQLDRFFGNIRVINLDKSRDRLVEIKEQLAKVGLKEEQYSRFRACLGAELPKETWSRMTSNYRRYNVRNPEEKAKLDKQHMGEAGCYMSHYLVIKETAENYHRAVEKLKQLEEKSGIPFDQIEAAKAEVKKYSSVLILEDDNGFERIVPPKGKPWQSVCKPDQTVRKGNGRLFYETMRDLPDDWDMLYFSTYNFRPGLITTSPRLLKLTKSVWLNAYAVNAKMYPKILKQLEKIETSTGPLAPVDDEIFALHPTSQCFLTNPALATQGETSEIHSEFVGQPIRRQYQADFVP